MNTAGEGEALNPQAVSVQLNVGGTTFRTTLRTLMEGAQSGGVVFKCLCSEILGTDAVGIAGTWAQRVVRVSEARDEYFVDADATPFEHWLSYLRTGVAPFVVAGPERERIIRVTEQAGARDRAGRADEAGGGDASASGLAARGSAGAAGAPRRCQLARGSTAGAGPKQAQL